MASAKEPQRREERREASEREGDPNRSLCSDRFSGDSNGLLCALRVSAVFRRFLQLILTAKGCAPMPAFATCAPWISPPAELVIVPAPPMLPPVNVIWPLLARVPFTVAPPPASVIWPLLVECRELEVLRWRGRDRPRVVQPGRRRQQAAQCDRAVVDQCAVDCAVPVSVAPSLS